MKKIITFIKSLVNGAVGSLDHNQAGFSQKKIIGYGVFAMVVAIHVALWMYQWRLGNFSQLAYTLGADLTFLAACLGINYMHEKNITNTPDATSTTDVTGTDTTPKA